MTHPRLTALALRTGPIDGISVSVEAGACLGISGPSGSGKSLLLRAIADLDPHAGTIHLNGNAQTDVAPTEWRRQVTWVAAESAWWADTVGAHFTHRDDPAWTALGFASESANWEISRLSTGEKQRLGLLRALQHAPLVLLLDEPTSALDASNTTRVEALIAAYRARTGAAVIWVSHDPAQLDRVSDTRLALGVGS
ncbi:MAG: ATP-binding cassette domain-containing protein [Gammaproteobacteria bacterium]|nr:ATP-binding cassette domain-containing protein [Gammaproteobacteria bacterium]MCP5136262.1 ATP-binding cassette domain-containing protein [Gammaproteobacteria bacterium]